MPRNVRSDLAQLARFWRVHPGTPIRWVAGTRADGTRTTVLELHDTLPRPPFRAPGHHLVVTSRPHRLAPAAFGSAARRVNHVAARGHGRTLTCLDRRGGPLAAVAYHLDSDPRAPLLVTVMAMRDGAVEISGFRPGTELGAALLLAYLARAAAVREAPNRLGLAARQTSVTALLGFTPAAPPSAYAAAPCYLEWRLPAGAASRCLDPNR